MTDSLLKTALKPLQTGLSGRLGSSIKGLTGLFGGIGFGGSGGSIPVAPFAEGGIVASPSYFPTGRGLGLMGAVSYTHLDVYKRQGSAYDAARPGPAGDGAGDAH